MYTALRVTEASRIELGKPSSERMWGAVGLLTAGLVLTIVAVFVLSVGNVVAAAPVEDVPCTVCGEASDPVQYTYLAALTAAEREMDVASGAGLVIGVPADPVQYTYLAALTAAEREMDAASGAGLVIGVPADPVQYTYLAAPRVQSLDRALSAYGARMDGLSGCYVRVLCSVR